MQLSSEVPILLSADLETVVEPHKREVFFTASSFEGRVPQSRSMRK